MIRSITREQLKQVSRILDQLNDEQLRQPLEILNDSTVGMHLRHILEFYQCLFHNLDSGHINYDLRQRDKEMETSISRCRECVVAITRQIDTCTEDFPLQLYADYSLDSSGSEVAVETTFFRELLYNVEHTVHHLAIIKIGLKSMSPSISLDEHLGVAASTVRNNKICAQ